MKKKVLFDDEEPSAADERRAKREPVLKVNEDYAARYEKSKQEQELRRLRSKYADDEANDKADDDDDDASSSTTEDSNAELDTPDKDAAFLRMLPLLVTKDPALMQSTEPVFDDTTVNRDEKSSKKDKSRKEKPLSIAEFRRQTLLERGAEGFANAEDDDDAAAAAAALPYAREQEELKRAFTAAADAAGADDADGDEDSGGLRVRQPVPKEKPQLSDVDSRLAAKSRSAAELSKVREFWTGASNVDEGERFLRDYIANQRWKGGSGGAALGFDGDGDDADGSDVLAEDQMSIAKRFDDVDSEDESEIERQEEFEHRYNFRFEEPGGTRLLSHPRSSNIESARRKDTRSAERRKRRAERKAAQKEEINAETRRLKTLARQQLSKKVVKLRKVAALEREAIEAARAEAADEDELAMLGTFTEEDLEGDFDPAAHDRRMEQLFGSEFYNNLLVDKKKPNFAIDAEDDDDGLEELLKEAGGFDEKPTDRAELPPSDDENDDKEQEPPADDDNDAAADEPAAEADTSSRKRKLPKLGTFAAARARLERQVEQDLGSYLDLDYEDIVAGEIKTRFRYTQVEPVSGDMDELEILKTPDAAMNQLLPLKKLAPYRDVRKLKGANWPWLKRNWMSSMRTARLEREKERERQREERRAAREERRSNKRRKSKKSKRDDDNAVADAE